MGELSIVKDFLASRIIASEKELDGYNPLYYQCTEDLIDGYLDVDFYEKEVLSILASGDQVLTAKYLEAATVDSFDKNPLAIYYYYLRRWSILFQNQLYPDIFQKGSIKDLLSKVKPKTKREQQILAFWKNHEEKETNIEKLFYRIDIQPDGKTLFEKASDVREVTDEVPFYHMDLFQEQTQKKEYDIIAISNILDWARNNPKKLEIVCENLANLTKPNGTIICSNLVSRSEKELKREEEIFSSHFQKQKCRKNYLYYKK